MIHYYVLREKVCWKIDSAETLKDYAGGKKKKKKMQNLGVATRRFNVCLPLSVCLSVCLVKGVNVKGGIASRGETISWKGFCSNIFLYLSLALKEERERLQFLFYLQPGSSCAVAEAEIIKTHTVEDSLDVARGKLGLKFRGGSTLLQKRASLGSLMTDIWFN